MGYSNSKIMKWLTLVMLAAGVLTSMLLPRIENMQYIPTVIYGIPVIYKEDPPGKLSSIGQILPYQNQIYIMDDVAGTVVVYDSEGNYIKTIAFYVPSFNGAFQMAVSGDYLYVTDNESNLYIFCEGAFVGFLEREYAVSILEQLDFERSSSQYIACFGSIWMKTNEGNICLIQKAYIALNYGHLIICLSVLPIIFIRKRNSTWNGSGIAQGTVRNH